MAEEGTLLNSFYEATVTLIPKAKTTHKKKTTGSITDEHRCKKSSTKYEKTQSNNTLRETYTMIKYTYSQGCKDSLIPTNR